MIVLILTNAMTAVACFAIGLLIGRVLAPIALPDDDLEDFTPASEADDSWP